MVRIDPQQWHHGDAHRPAGQRGINKRLREKGLWMERFPESRSQEWERQQPAIDAAIQRKRSRPHLFLSTPSGLCGHCLLASDVKVRIPRRRGPAGMTEIVMLHKGL